MAGVLAAIIYAGIATYAVFCFMDWIKMRRRDMVKKVKGKPNEPVECKIHDGVSKQRNRHIDRQSLL